MPTVVEADDELLWGIRGAGGNFGVIVEMTMKVHRCDKVIGGLMCVPMRIAQKTIAKYVEFLDHREGDWQSHFGGDIGFNMHLPGLPEPVVVVSSLWIDDLEEGNRFVDEIRKILTTFEPLALEVVNQVTPIQFS
jgi:hypothetical protein